MQQRGVSAMQTLDDDLGIENDNAHGRHAKLTKHAYKRAAGKRLSTDVGSVGIGLPADATVIERGLKHLAHT